MGNTLIGNHFYLNGLKRSVLAEVLYSVFPPPFGRWGKGGGSPELVSGSGWGDTEWYTHDLQNLFPAGRCAACLALLRENLRFADKMPVLVVCVNSIRQVDLVKIANLTRIKVCPEKLDMVSA